MTTGRVSGGRALRPAWSGLGRGLVQLGGLVLPVDCAGCGAPDAGLCRHCRAAVSGPVRRVRLSALPTGPPAWAAAGYRGPVRCAVVAWKERGRGDLTRHLSVGLAGAVLALAVVRPEEGAEPPGAAGGCRPGQRPVPGAWAPSTLRSRSVLIVPIPSSPAARRRRGGQLVTRLAVQAAARARAAGADVRVVPALRLVRRVDDQSGLGRSGRGANLDHALAVRRSAAALVAGRRCVVVDDILTTGVTVREACRALDAAGAVPVGIAACCATPLVGGLSEGADLH